MITKIQIEINGEIQAFSIDDAKKLYEELKVLFGEKHPVPINPNYIDFHRIIGTEHFPPLGPPYDVWCNS